MQAEEKLKPMEMELYKIEAQVKEIVDEMDYLRTREQKLRDTNESTNERVKWFAFGTMGMLVGLGAWQVIYLRAYFRYVRCGRGDVLVEHGADGRIGRSILSRTWYRGSDVVKDQWRRRPVFGVGWFDDGPVPGRKHWEFMMDTMLEFIDIAL